MSGLAGLINLDSEPLAEKIVSSFLAANSSSGEAPGVIHRYLNGAVAIAETPGLFPFVAPKVVRSEDQRMILHFWGELYNDDLPNQRHLEAIISSYQKEGARLFIRLNGSFILGWLDEGDPCLRLVCDRTASLPLFYCKTGNLFAFSSKLRPFLNLPHLKHEFDIEAVANFLACGYVLGKKTPLKNVQVLGPAEMLTIQANEVNITNYWQFTFAEERDHRTDDQIVKNLEQLICQAIRRRTSDGLPYGILLSGGYDSRVILGCAKKLHPGRPLSTITWGEQEDLPASDTLIAKELAHWAGSKHTFYPIRAGQLVDNFRKVVSFNEGRTDAVGNYTDGLGTFERIRDELNSAFILRGDECFGWKENVNTEEEALHSLSVHYLARLTQNYHYFYPDRISSIHEANHQQLARLQAECPHQYIHDRKDYFYFYWRLFGYLNPLSQLKEHAIWIRNPFLDNDLLDLITRLPTRMRLGKAIFKTTVRSMFPELQQFEIAQFNNLVDWDKSLVTDLDLQNFVNQILFESTNGFDELIDRHKLRSYLDTIYAHGAVGRSTAPRRRNIFNRIKSRWQRQLGKYELSPSTEIIRLMILKIWADEFTGGEFKMG